MKVTDPAAADHQALLRALVTRFMASERPACGVRLRVRGLDDNHCLAVEVLGLDRELRDRTLVDLADFVRAAGVEISIPAETVDGSSLAASGGGLLIRSAHSVDRMRIPTTESIMFRGGGEL